MVAPHVMDKRIGCLLSSRSSQRAPLQLVSSASDMMLYADFGAGGPPRQDCTREVGSGDRPVGAPTAYCRADSPPPLGPLGTFAPNRRFPLSTHCWH
jgi:hypothetical protein